MRVEACGVCRTDLHVAEGYLPVHRERVVPGRVKVYEAIVQGENIPEPGIPESFKVLVKEMKSLCLNVEVLSSDGQIVELRDSEDDYRASEEFGIDLSRRPGADPFSALDLSLIHI